MIEKIRALLNTGKYTLEAIAVELRTTPEKLAKEIGVPYSAEKDEKTRKPIQIINGDEGENPENKLSSKDIEEIGAAISRLEESLKRSTRPKITEIRDDIYTIRRHSRLPLECAKKLYNVLTSTRMHELEKSAKALSAAVSPARTEIKEALMQIFQDEAKLEAALLVDTDEGKRTEDVLQNVVTAQEAADTPISNLVQSPKVTANKGNKTKMDQMREKYRQLYGAPKGDAEVKVEQQSEEELSDEDIAKIEAALLKIEEQLTDFNSKKGKGTNKKEFRVPIFEQMKGINNFNKSLPIEYAARYYKSLDSKGMSELVAGEPACAGTVRNRKKELVVRISEIISRRKDQIDDPKELQELLKFLTPSMLNRYPGTVGGVRSAIARKIDAHNNSVAMANIRNITPDISQIVSDLASGKIDIEKAKATIKEEAQRRAERAPNTKWALSEDQQYDQILKQISIQLQENPDEYRITNPAEAIKQIKRLCRVDDVSAARTVVQNLIGREEYEESNFIKAKTLCGVVFGAKSSDAETRRSMQLLEKDIAKAEIGGILRVALNKTQTPEEDKVSLDRIEYKLQEYERLYGLESSGTCLSAISLGKSFDGTRKITLADVWIGNKVRQTR